ncbi:MAG: YhbY family RNA-binding protein [Ostreibacterium sp.]
MLTNKQIKHLRVLSHDLYVILQTGEKGLTEAIQNEISNALKAHELIKIKLNAERDERQTMIETITATQKCEAIKYIGKTVTLFKRNSNNIKIELPKASVT